MVHERNGFSLPEMLFVMIIFGLLLGIAFPKFVGMRERAAVSAAKQQIASAIARARQTAIHEGKATRFLVSGNEVAVVVIPTSDTVLRRTPLDQGYGVTLDASGGSAVSIDFDPRGFSTTTALRTYPVVLGSRRDSVCVVGFGTIKTEGC